MVRKNRPVAMGPGIVRNAATMRDSLRILGLITHSGRGGARDAMLKLQREMKVRGHAFEVIFLYAPSQDVLGESDRGVVLSVRKPSVIDYLRMFPRLYKLIRNRHPDALITFLPLACVLGSLASWLAGVDCRIASHRTTNTGFSPILRGLDLVAGTLGLYSAIIGNSKAVCESFRAYPKLYTRRLRVVYNGLDFEPSRSTPTEARQRLGLPLDVTLIGSTGRLVSQKNYDLLIKVLPELPGAHLAIAGEGPLREDLIDLATKLAVRERVIFLGAIPRRDVPTFLRALDIFVLPSRFEGLSNSLLEALGAGLPTVVSDIPEQLEALRSSKEGELAGLVVSADETEVWIDELQRLAKDTALRTELAARARARAKEFSSTNMSAGYLETIYEVMPR